MDGFDVWDGILLAIGAFVAVMALVRLMSNKRQQLTQQLEKEIHAEQQRMRAEEQKRKKLEARARQRAGRAA